MITLFIKFFTINSHLLLRICNPQVILYQLIANPLERDRRNFT